MPKLPTILYDPQMFDLQNYGGISRYFTNLISGVQKSEGFKAKLPLVYSTNYYVRHFPQLLNNRIGRKYLKRPQKRSKWNLNFSKYQIKNANFDIFHATYYNPYFLETLKKPLIVTVHDMIYENHSHSFEDADEIIKQKKTVIEAADLIIAISEYTKQEILRYYPNSINKIRVIYHGLPETQLSAAKEDLPKKFLLYVGDRSAGYKNFKPLVEAISPFLNKKNDLYFICAGGGAFNQEELDLLKKFNISQYAIQINSSDSLMMQLYQQAEIFLYPSLEEGFGLPMLEAFKNGCAIACSNTSCLPEVGGDAVSYFDPKNIQSIHQTISELIEDADLQAKHIIDGYEQLKKFTFSNCLDQTLDCYRLLLTKV